MGRDEGRAEREYGYAALATLMEMAKTDQAAVARAIAAMKAAAEETKNQAAALPAAVSGKTSTALKDEIASVANGVLETFDKAKLKVESAAERLDRAKGATFLACGATR